MSKAKASQGRAPHPSPLPAPSGIPGNSAKEPRDARRRRQLIEATITCIAENGLSGTTVARVAEIAELSAGVVNFYFRTKAALLLSTLNYVDGAFSKRQEEARKRAGHDPIAQLDAMIEADFDPEVCDRRRVAVWTAFWGEAQARDDYLRVCGDREESSERDVVDLFERIVVSGGRGVISISMPPPWGAPSIIFFRRFPNSCSAVTSPSTSMPPRRPAAPS